MNVLVTWSRPFDSEDSSEDGLYVWADKVDEEQLKNGE